MSYVPGCTSDVFVSYAHADDEDGWVTALKESLERRLRSFVPGADVWIDDRLRTGDLIKSEIQQKLRDSAFLVAVISPAYLESDFCMRHELEWFQNQGGKDLFQLVKTPLDSGCDVPFPQALYTNLHDASDGHPLRGPELDKVLDAIVVKHIYARLRECRDARPRLFVAQVRDEALKPRWDELKRRLHSEGYGVVPKKILNVREPDSQILKEIAGARLSICWDGMPGDSFVQRQLDLIKSVGKPTLAMREPPFDGEIQDVLGKIERMMQSQPAASVYVIYDPYSDGRESQQMTGLCAQVAALTKCKVLQPESGEKCHLHRLRTSTGILLYYSEAPDDWLKAQEDVMRRAAALRDAPFVPEAFYKVRKGDSTEPRVTRGARQEWIIERSGEPKTDDLRPFLDAVEKRARATSGTTG